MALTLSVTPESYSKILGARYEFRQVFTPYATPTAVNLSPFGGGRELISSMARRRCAHCEGNFFARQTVL